jgi:hypothetical protein
MVYRSLAPPTFPEGLPPTDYKGPGILLLEDKSERAVLYALNLDGSLIHGCVFSDDAGLPEQCPIRLVLSDGVTFIVVHLSWNTVDRHEWLVVYDVHAITEQPDDPANLLRCLSA